LADPTLYQILEVTMGTLCFSNVKRVKPFSKTVLVTSDFADFIR
jgi:hypothetical protein